ncbi:MAG: NAD(P)-binding domain-containing protein, partial [Kiritimatiellia bacterium]
MNIGFIGLGVMGQSMAGHLLASGAKLHVYNRSPAKAEALLERGAVWEASVRALAESC